MFNQTRYGKYSVKTTNNNTGATIKIMAFVFGVVAVALAMWALFSAFNTFSEGVSRTWNPGNNDSLIMVVGGAVGTAIEIGAAVVGLLAMIAIVPWFIRNFRVALMTPIAGERRDYNVIEGEPDEVGLIEDKPRYGLLMDKSYEDYYIDATHQLTDDGEE